MRKVLGQGLIVVVALTALGCDVLRAVRAGGRIDVEEKRKVSLSMCSCDCPEAETAECACVVDDVVDVVEVCDDE